MDIDHNDSKIIKALGLSEEQLLFVGKTIEKVFNRTIDNDDYGKSNSLQDIVTCNRIHSNEYPEEPITEKELLLVFTGWQLGLIQDKLDELKAYKVIAKEMKKMIEHYTSQKK